MRKVRSIQFWIGFLACFMLMALSLCILVENVKTGDSKESTKVMNAKSEEVTTVNESTQNNSIKDTNTDHFSQVGYLNDTNEEKKHLFIHGIQQLHHGAMGIILAAVSLLFTLVGTCVSCILIFSRYKRRKRKYKNEITIKSL